MEQHTVSAPIRVLVAPLHWGLGHATRCIPVIRAEIKCGNKVIIAARGPQRALLKDHFPGLEFTDIAFPAITFPEHGQVLLHFALRIIPALWAIRREHRILQKIIQSHGIDKVISDSRFGLWNKGVRSIFISHQIHIPAPFFSGLINRLNLFFMNQFDEVWIPDYPAAPGLAGAMSHPHRMPNRFRYIGPQSRFDGPIKKCHPYWKLLVLISGPEPARTRFEREMTERCAAAGGPCLIIRGQPEETQQTTTGEIYFTPHLSDEALKRELSRTEHIIARSGYSTIMDFHALGVEAEWHATLGQPEQEYLARLHTAQP